MALKVAGSGKKELEPEPGFCLGLNRRVSMKRRWDQMLVYFGGLVFCEDMSLGGRVQDRRVLGVV